MLPTTLFSRIQHNYLRLFNLLCSFSAPLTQFQPTSISLKSHLMSTSTPVIKYHTPPDPNSPPEQLTLSAIAAALKIRLKSADMPFAMQERALRLARSFLDSSNSRRPNLTNLARSIKKDFDKCYGLAWHCVAGKSFGSFVTYSPGGFIYFSVDSYSVLLFKTEVHLISDDPRPR